MNLDELFEKCRLAAGEVRDYLVTGCGLDGSANCWYSVDIDDWLVIARAQLRKAIPLVLQEVGRWLEENGRQDWDEHSHQSFGWVVPEQAIEALKRGRMPE